MLPIQIVEKESFKALVKNFDPHYKLLTRKCMFKKAISDLYSDTRASVKSLEQNVAIRMVLSEDRKTTHLIPIWQDSMVLESVNAALS